MAMITQYITFLTDISFVRTCNTSLEIKLLSLFLSASTLWNSHRLTTPFSHFQALLSTLHEVPNVLCVNLSSQRDPLSGSLKSGSHSFADRAKRSKLNENHISSFKQIWTALFTGIWSSASSTGTSFRDFVFCSRLAGNPSVFCTDFWHVFSQLCLQENCFVAMSNYCRIVVFVFLFLGDLVTPYLCIKMSYLAITSLGWLLRTTFRHETV